MQPNSDQNSRGLTVPSRSSNPQSPPPTHQAAAADVMRQKIERIYSTPQPNEQIAAAYAVPTTPVDDVVPEPHSEPVSSLAMPNLPTIEVEDHTQQHQSSPQPTPHGRVIEPLSSQQATPATNVYDQTHSDQEDAQAFTRDSGANEHWKQYHSAWQSYYQQYYERYYVAQVHKQRLDTESKKLDAEDTHQNQPVASLSKDQAVGELRSDLMRKVEQQTTKIKKSRHFVPALIGVGVAGVFLFLQLNPLMFASFYSWTTPASSLSPNIIVDPSASTKVSDEPRIIIPKINVDAPVVYDVNTLAESVIQSRLKEGVVHYPIPGANALPGQIGNSVILGHSSNDVFDDGQYKFIFVQLDRLDAGDVFYLHYQGTRYAYSVTEKQIIEPTEVNKLVLNNGTPMASLVTCTPPGTALKRLVVYAEQISPDPAKATAQSEEQQAKSDDTERIGGDARSFFDRLFSPAN